MAQCDGEMIFVSILRSGCVIYTCTMYDFANAVPVSI